MRAATEDSSGLSGQGSQINPNQGGLPVGPGGVFFFQGGGPR